MTSKPLHPYQIVHMSLAAEMLQDLDVLYRGSWCRYFSEELSEGSLFLETISIRLETTPSLGKRSLICVVILDRKKRGIAGEIAKLNFVKN